MKELSLLRIVALLLAVLMLVGCAGKEEAKIEDEVEATRKPVEKEEPQQEEMPPEILDQALNDIDMAMLCAGFAMDQRIEKLNNPYQVMQEQVVCTDYDGDGYRDVLVEELTFSLKPQRVAGYTFAQSGPVYYTDNAGTIYARLSWDDSFDIEVEGKPGWVDHLGGSYQKWENGNWESVYSYGGSITYISEGDELVEVENTVVATMDGQDCTKAELDAYFAQIGLRRITEKPSAYTRYSYDAVYEDSLVEGLYAYFPENYDGFAQMYRHDFDNDGVVETLFLVPDFVAAWRNNVQVIDGHSDIQNARDSFKYTAFDEECSYTGVVLLDVADGKLNVTVDCLPEDYSQYSILDVRLENGFLWLDGRQIYLSGYFNNVAKENVPAAISDYMSDFGYGNSFFRMVDVTEYDGDEYMCICHKDGVWYAFVIVIMDGDPVVMYGNSLQNSAVYLTEYEGQECLLVYNQSVYMQNGITYTNYNYSLERIKLDCQTQYLDFGYANYSDEDENATAVSQFFQKLNVYLTRIIVICDPYKLTGSAWMAPTEAVYGTVPQEESQQPEENEETVMGFVQIEDPSSWLHLRVGPGIEYDKVLMDPSDPDSFVRQALGSPVTVLETIETNDPENPVWLKIRILYADREIIGYSSKTYIRLVTE